MVTIPTNFNVHMKGYTYMTPRMMILKIHGDYNHQVLYPYESSTNMTSNDPWMTLKIGLPSKLFSKW